MVFVFTSVATVDAIPLLRQRRWRDLAAFALIWGAGLGLALLGAFHVRVPTPLRMLVDLARRLGDHPIPEP